MMLCLNSDPAAQIRVTAPADTARGGPQIASPVIELVSFRLTAGTGTAEFLAAARGTEAPLRRQQGFHRRMLTLGQDGTWTDLVEWSDLHAAQAGAEAMMAEPAFQPFLALIDMASVRMSHPEVQWRMD